MTPIQTLLYSRLATDPSSSTWLLDAIRSSFERDPVDAVNDAEILLSVLTSHLNQVFAATSMRMARGPAAEQTIPTLSDAVELRLNCEDKDL